MLVEEAPDGLLSPKTQSSFSKLVYATPPPQGLKRKLDFDAALTPPIKQLFLKECDTDVDGAASSDDEYLPEKDSMSLLSSPIPVSRARLSFDKRYKTSTPRKRTSDRIEKKAAMARGEPPVNIFSPPTQVLLDPFAPNVHSTSLVSYFLPMC